jgi:hypothetical protein
MASRTRAKVERRALFRRLAIVCMTVPMVGACLRSWESADDETRRRSPDRGSGGTAGTSGSDNEGGSVDEGGKGGNDSGTGATGGSLGGEGGSLGGESGSASGTSGQGGVGGTSGASGAGVGGIAGGAGGPAGSGGSGAGSGARGGTGGKGDAGSGGAAGSSACMSPRPATVLPSPLPNGSRLHVAVTGSDTTGNGSAATPYRTIGYAFRHLADATVVLVAPGMYCECVVFGLAQDGLVLAATETGAAIIDGTGCEHTIRVRSGLGSQTMIRGFVIQNGVASGGIDEGGGIFIESPSSPTIEYNVIRDNQAWSGGGGISIAGGASVVRGNVIANNTVTYDGGGINVIAGTPTIEYNLITGNEADRGGGISCRSNCSATIHGNVIHRNEATDVLSYGGGIFVYESSPVIVNNLLVENVGRLGGAIGVESFQFKSEPIINSNTLVGNAASYGAGIAFEDSAGGNALCRGEVKNNIVAFSEVGGDQAGGEAFHFGLTHDIRPELLSNQLWENAGGPTGGEPRHATLDPSNVEAYPAFVCGPLDAYYLSSIGAGQSTNSSGLNAGPESSADAGLNLLTTTTDGAPDEGLVDRGYHRYRQSSANALATPIEALGEGTERAGSGGADSGATVCSGTAGTGGSGGVSCTAPQPAPLAFPELPQGTKVFVDTTGSDATGNGSEQAPYATISYALRHRNGVMAVVVRPGTYRECVVIGSADNGVSLEAVPRGSATIDGTGCEPAVKMQTGLTSATRIRGFVIENGSSSDRAKPGGGIYVEPSSSPVIEGNVIRDCFAWYGGGAIGIAEGSSAVVRANVLQGNSTESSGGAIHVSGASPIIERNLIADNVADTNGGAIQCEDGCSATIRENVIYENRCGVGSSGNGGGIAIDESSPTIVNNLFVENAATGYFAGGSRGGTGGAIYMSGIFEVVEPLIANNTFVGNAAEYGGTFAFGAGGGPAGGSMPQIVRNIVAHSAFGETRSGGEAFFFYSDENMVAVFEANQLWENLGGPLGGDPQYAQGLSSNFEADPRFACGPLDGYYLGATSAGQASNSPAIDAGLVPANSLGLSSKTTSTNGELDVGIVDLGYHR